MCSFLNASKNFKICLSSVCFFCLWGKDGRGYTAALGANILLADRSGVRLCSDTSSFSKLWDPLLLTRSSIKSVGPRYAVISCNSCPLLSIMALHWSMSFGFSSVLLGNCPCDRDVKTLAIWPIWVSKFFIDVAWLCMRVFWFWSMRSISSTLGFLSTVSWFWNPGGRLFGLISGPACISTLLSFHEKFWWFFHPGLYVFEYGFSCCRLKLATYWTDSEFSEHLSNRCSPQRSHVSTTCKLEDNIALVRAATWTVKFFNSSTLWIPTTFLRVPRSEPY